ncbi:MAG: MBL fold metallo-hydrolase [Chloroflexi bacterium]|nr:MBL fold metallo-hydrolase [Chloroflexota bacterium]
MSGEFRITFHGVRGSYPCPNPRMMRVGGNTACVEVLVDGHLIIIDAGTGIINLGRQLLQRAAVAGNGRPTPLHITLLFSHTHHDHTQGFPFFQPAYLGASTLYVFGPRMLRENLEEALARSMRAPNFPVEITDLQSTRVVRNIDEAEMLVLLPGQPAPEVRNIYHDPLDMPPDAVSITLLKSYAHPTTGTFMYRIAWRNKSVVYASDTESYVGGDSRLIAFAKGADLLIHDAQFTHEEYVGMPSPRQGWGHSTPDMAIAVAQAAGVNQLALFHHDPLHEDEQVDEIGRQARARFPGALVASERLSVDI